MLSPTKSQDPVEDAVHALESGNGDFRAILDDHPVPAYVTDAEGILTYWNRACAEFAGREPRVGEDRWCVTWRMRTPTDESLPHDSCPLAMAIKERHEIRGELVIALRPDGSRKAFAPYTTLLYGKDGELTGAINLLIDVTDEQAEALADQAARCRRLADATCDRQVSRMLRHMAEGYERNAVALRAPHMVRFDIAAA